MNGRLTHTIWCMFDQEEDESSISQTIGSELWRSAMANTRLYAYRSSAENNSACVQRWGRRYLAIILQVFVDISDVSNKTHVHTRDVATWRSAGEETALPPSLEAACPSE
jgi:hypothetical protein